MRGVTATELFPNLPEKWMKYFSSQPIWEDMKFEGDDEYQNCFFNFQRWQEIQKALKNDYPGEWNYRKGGFGIIPAPQAIMIHKSVKIPDNVHFGDWGIIIEKGAVIRPGAYIRKNTWICENAVVGHCSEIKNSVLLPGAKAPHFNYVGDSILGPDVNLGAGCKLSNLRNDRKTVLLRDSGTGETIDSELKKIGAILGEGVQIGCNVVTNPGVILGPECNVWPNVTVSGIYSAGTIIKD
tara:strand:+ start:135 stop:851 length:717 start_codon:yes stop_codon:yes gene_type:complete